MDRFHELKVFIAVAETGGFAKAASRLRSSPPAITRAIAALEQRLGTELVTRTTRRVHLTEAGQLFLERARHLLSDLDSAEKEVTGEGSMPSGQLTITASVTMGRSILPPVVTGFLETHPRVMAKVLLLDRVVDLVEEGIDIALRVGELPDSTMIARQVGEVRRMLVASPAYLTKRGVPKAASDLKLHSIIAFTGLMPNREWTYVGERGAQRVALQPRFEINDATAAIAAAEAGDGITIALSYMVSKQIQDGRLSPVLSTFCPPAVPVQLVYPESRLVAPKVRAFVDYATPRIRAALHDLKPGVRPSTSARHKR
ncbi:MAG TPA: LysR family transcriptional regulator [Propylenella sp.]